MANQSQANIVISKDLHETGSLIPAILNRSPYFIGVSRKPFSKFIMVNETGWKLFGMSNEMEMLTKDITRFFADDISKKSVTVWKRQLNEQGFFNQALTFKTKTGKELWAMLRMDSFIHGEHEYQLVSIINIGEIKRAEDTALREQEKFRTLFENSTIGIIATSITGEIALINHFAEEQFGYSKGELIGSKIETLIPREVRRRHVAHREKFVKEMHARPMGIGMDLYALRKDGTKFPVEISLSHFTTQEGTFAIAFISDITVRKKNEDAIFKQQDILQKYAEEVRALNQQLEERVEERTLALRETMQQLEKSKDELQHALNKEKELSDLKSRFVSMASHEFRTPLSSILSSASLIEKYPAEDQQEKRRKHIHRIKENVKNLTDILEDFLSLGKLEEGLIQPKRETVNIFRLVNEVVYDINEINRNEQKIIYTHNGKEEFECDKHLLKNILINLLSNAIKFSKDGSAVDIRTEVTTNKFTLSISDHGIGISEEDQEHLFDRFFRGNNAVNIKGTGLGLHIVLKYLELMGGSITCKSKLNEGTEFIITISQI